MRPALVVSTSRYNRISRDVIVMKITSRKQKLIEVSLKNDDLLAGSLDHPSYIQADGIYALEIERIFTSIGTVRPEKMQEIRNLILDLLFPDGE